jgi:hypothetical protein
MSEPSRFRGAQDVVLGSFKVTSAEFMANSEHAANDEKQINA